MTSGEPLTPGELKFLDKYSGTTPDPEALERDLRWTRRALATTKMPEVPHVEEIRQALPDGTDKYEAIRVAAFVDNGMIYDPDTDEQIIVRQWLRLGRDLRPVLALANSLKHGM